MCCLCFSCGHWTNSDVTDVDLWLESCFWYVCEQDTSWLWPLYKLRERGSFLTPHLLLGANITQETTDMAASLISLLYFCMEDSKWTFWSHNLADPCVFMSSGQQAVVPPCFHLWYFLCRVPLPRPPPLQLQSCPQVSAARQSIANPPQWTFDTSIRHHPKMTKTPQIPPPDTPPPPPPHGEGVSLIS